MEFFRRSPLDKSKQKIKQAKHNFCKWNKRKTVTSGK